MGTHLISILGRFVKMLRFYTVKLPFVYAMIALGFVFEFLLTYPYMVLVAIDQRRQARTRHNSHADRSRGPEGA